jgi:hypothetical protein
MEAAAVLTATVPGATLFHEGQFEGNSMKVPIQLTRKPAEPVNNDIKDFYQMLLKEIKEDIYHQGDWKLLDVFSTEDNEDTHHNIIAYQWTLQKRQKIIAANLADQDSYAYIRPILHPGKDAYTLVDRITNERHERKVSEVNTKGLYIKLAPYKAHIFDVR